MSSTQAKTTVISIAIPTRERAAYLPSAMKTVLAIDDPDIEIVVSDNASDDGTADYLRSLSDPRLKVLRTERRVSMRENFERTLGACCGDYVLFIGDDDGVLPRQFPILRSFLETYRPDTLSWPWVQYAWPVEGSFGRVGQLRIERRKFYGQPESTEIEYFRDRLLHARPKISGEMPGIYHAVCSVGYLRSITPAGAPVFGGRIPDLYASFLATLAGGNHMHCSHVFTINGSSPASTGASHGAHSGRENCATPATRFHAEALTDPVEDVAFFGLGVPHVMFSTLETVRVRNELEHFLPDYKAWYTAIVAGSNKFSDELRDLSIHALRQYAATTKSTDQLDWAITGRRSLLDGLKRHLVGGFSKRLVRSLANLHSFRVALPTAGDRSIHGACALLDHLLGDEARAAVQGEMSRVAAWKALVGRSGSIRVGRR